MVDVKTLSDKDLDTLYSKIIAERDVRNEKRKETAFQKAIELMSEFNDLCDKYNFAFSVEDYNGCLDDSRDWVLILGLRKI